MICRSDDLAFSIPLRVTWAGLTMHKGERAASELEKRIPVPRRFSLRETGIKFSHRVGTKVDSRIDKGVRSRKSSFEVLLESESIRKEPQRSLKTLR
jgi:hypothetical protein